MNHLRNTLPCDPNTQTTLLALSRELTAPRRRSELAATLVSAEPLLAFRRELVAETYAAIEEDDLDALIEELGA